MSPRVSVVLLAAGASSRMGGPDKLLQPVFGVAMLRHCTLAALASKAGRTFVVLAPEMRQRFEALAGLDVAIVPCAAWRDGMSASIAAGVAAASGDSDAIIIALADMPDVTAGHFDRLITAFAPNAGHEICRANTFDGRVGHPVLFGQRFFAALAQLQGDSGAKDVLQASRQSVVEVPTPGQGAITDIDSPEDWRRWNS